jgi:hypothetical protein
MCRELIVPLRGDGIAGQLVGGIQLRVPIHRREGVLQHLVTSADSHCLARTPQGCLRTGDMCPVTGG